MRYHTKDPYKLLTESGLPYAATERFALDQLLGRQVRKIDIYIAYISSGDLEAWKLYLNGKATEVQDFPNLILIPSKDAHLFKDGLIAPLETLAEDIPTKAPRYFTRRHREVFEKAPDLYFKILELCPLDSLNLPDTAPKAQ